MGSAYTTVSQSSIMTTLGLIVLLTVTRVFRCYSFQINILSLRRQTSLSFSLSNPEISRYSRHLVLSDVGMKGQEALKKASILMIGAGGLGSPALLYLAAAGIGHLGIVDGDTVDESNLQRQIIHSVNTLGMSKCESAAQSIRDINPFVSVRTFEEEFTAATAERIITGGFDDQTPWDVVIDGSDNFPTKYLIKYVYILSACQQLTVVLVMCARYTRFLGSIRPFSPLKGNFLYSTSMRMHQTIVIYFLYHRHLAMSPAVRKAVSWAYYRAQWDVYKRQKPLNWFWDTLRACYQVGYSEWMP